MHDGNLLNNLLFYILFLLTLTCSCELLQLVSMQHIGKYEYRIGENNVTVFLIKFKKNVLSKELYKCQNFMQKHRSQ